MGQQTATEIVGVSDPLQQVIADARLVAAAGTSVLIEGETGTGKELFARFIHGESRRASHPLVSVNCAAIPANLIESEFFGHERGAFTGATQRQIGRFVQAHGGTLFLDEVGELPLELQAKLLRVVQEREVEPVGGGKAIAVDVRLIAATNRDLAAEVRAGRFREDLYYRLSVFPLRLPALRDRPADIPLLAAAFVARLARELKRDFAPLTTACVRTLQAHAWPGNVRELENVIERAALTARDGRLNLERALSPTFAAQEPPVPAARAVFDPSDEQRVFTVAELWAFERANMQRALERTRGRVSGEGGAARLLGIPASTFGSRMKALGVAREGWGAQRSAAREERVRSVANPLAMCSPWSS